MRVDGIVMPDWLAARTGHVSTDANEPLAFGQNVTSAPSRAAGSLGNC